MIERASLLQKIAPPAECRLGKSACNSLLRARSPFLSAFAALLLAAALVPLTAQTPPSSQAAPATQPASQVHSAPATDSSIQSSPIIANPAAPAKANDIATQASPMAQQPQGDSLAAGASLQLSIAQTLDSGKTHNGDRVSATLSNSVRTSAGRTLGSGTPAILTVVAAVPAGKLESAGEITLQVIRVGNVELLSDVVTRRGTPGPKELPDSTPAKGTDAVIAAGTTLTFTVPTTPKPAP